MISFINQYKLNNDYIFIMLNWNKISEWGSKAKDVSYKMKDFAKDLITVEESDE